MVFVITFVIMAAILSTFLKTNNPVILFDGHCNMCNSAVIFTIRRDSKKLFLFTSLQSETGKAMLRENNIDSKINDSFVLIYNGKAHLRSTAALKTCKLLRHLWPLLYVFIIVPRPVRDFIYNFVARHRYKWFGKRDYCMVPEPEMKERFI